MNRLRHLKKNHFLRIVFSLCLLFSSFATIACDTTPIISASPPIDIGGGFFTVDIQICIGSGNSFDGFSTSIGGGLNITGFSPSSLVSNSSNIAIGSLSGGILNYDFPMGSLANPFALQTDCFNFTITTDGNPSNETVSLDGVNDNCGSGGIQTYTLPPICLVDFSITAPGSQSGNTTGAGNNCNNSLSDDQTIEVFIPCERLWRFSLCGSATWNTQMFLSSTCCGPIITSNDNACSSQSAFNQFLATGTYYITIEGSNAFQDGAYTLEVTDAATLNAGSDATVCGTAPASLSGFSQGIFTSTVTISWTTLGDGTFSNPSSFSTNYTPGPTDIANGTATLIMSGSDTSSCPLQPDSVTVTIFPTGEDATFNYPSASYCASDVNPTPTISGTPGGTFTSTPSGLSLNSSTGVINLSASNSGSYGVLYSTPTLACRDTLTMYVTILSDDDPTFAYTSTAYCLSDLNPIPTISGTPGGTFTSSPPGLSVNPVTGEIDLSISTSGVFDVLYTTPGTCFDSLNISLTITDDDDPSFNYPNISYCKSDINPTPIISGTPGGTFTSSSTGLNITSGTGEIDLSMSLAGVYAILYTTPGICSDTLTTFITIVDQEDPSFNYSQIGYCSNEIIDPTPTITGETGGTFTSSLGLNINGITGTIDLSTSTPGIYNVLYTTPGVCFDTLGISVTIYPTPVIGATASDTVICHGEFVALNGSGANTYEWSRDVIDGVVFSPDFTSTYRVVGVDTNNCVDSNQITITINPLPIVDLGNDSGICEIPIKITPGLGFISYLWQDSSTNSSLIIKAPGLYRVDVIDDNGCTAYDDVFFEEECSFRMWIPNSFTPNGDNKNDVFNAKGKNLESYQMIVFNRWGESIFETNSLSVGWNGTNKSGTIVQNGTYSFQIKFSYLVKENLIHDKRNGKIILVR